MRQPKFLGYVQSDRLRRPVLQRVMTPPTIFPDIVAKEKT